MTSDIHWIQYEHEHSKFWRFVKHLVFVLIIVVTLLFLFLRTKLWERLRLIVGHFQWRFMSALIKFIPNSMHVVNQLGMLYAYCSKNHAEMISAWNILVCPIKNIHKLPARLHVRLLLTHNCWRFNDESVCDWNSIKITR